MTMRAHILFWAAGLAAFLILVWVLSGVLLPFVVAGAIAYLLNPPIKKLVAAGVPRFWSALGILLLFFAGFGGVLALILPFAYREAVQLAQALPGYAEQVQAHIAPYIALLQERFDGGDFTAVQDGIKNNLGTAFRLGADVLGRVAGGTQAVAGVMMLVVLVPILAFMMVVDWARMTQWIDDLIPRAAYDTVRDLLSRIDRRIAGFVRGQLMIAAALGLIYALGLALLGLKFGVLIGLMIGVLSVVPLLGAAVGLVASVGVAWLQSGDIAYVGMIAGFFLLVQLVDSNIVTPRIMSQSVELHPLWVLFALMAGGTMFGVVGMFLAVPVAATIGVLGGYGLSRYKSSPYYGQPGA